MKRNLLTPLILLAAAGGASFVWHLVVPSSLGAAQGEAETETESSEQVIVERQALNPIPPKTYQVSLQLVPSQYQTIVAPQDGVIQDLDAEAGTSVVDGALLFELDNSEQTLLKQKAEAQVALHKLKIEQAKSRKDADAEAFASAELAVAEIDLQLADLRLQRATVRALFPGKVFRVHVREKEFVTANQPIVELGDDSTMYVEIPIDRKVTKVGDVITLTIEGTAVDGKITGLTAAPDRFAPLRDVYESLASARVELDNRAGAFLMGQTAYAPLIPREMVAEVPNSAIASGGDNQRKIQVLRHFVVRDVPVNVLAPVGQDRSFVTGAFDADDEVIVSASIDLADGTQLARDFGEGAAGASDGGPNRRSPAPRKGRDTSEDVKGF